MKLDLSRLRPRNQSLKTREQETVLSFDAITNGVGVLLNDTPRTRFGKKELPTYIQKAGGMVELASVSGQSGKINGFFIYIDPNSGNSNRTQVFFANQYKIYQYDVVNDVVTEVRDVATSDSGDILFFQGIRMKKYGYFVVGDDSISGTLYRYAGKNTGSVTAVADNGSGKTRMTCTAHGLNTGNTVITTGFTEAYNGTYVVTKIDADTFDLEALTYTATDTGSFEGFLFSKETITALNASRRIGSLDDRLLIANTGDDSNRSQYSDIQVSGFNYDFTSDTAVDGGGLLSGINDEITAFAEIKGIGLAFMRNEVTAHTIGKLTSGTGDPIKDTKTINEQVGVSGFGTYSPKGVVIANDKVFFVHPNGVFQSDPYVTQGRLVDLTKNFRPVLQNFDLTDSSIAYDPKQNALLVTASSSEGLPQNRILFYSFDTKTWSVLTKQLNQLGWDNVNEKLIGSSSLDPVLYDLSAEGYTNAGSKYEMTCETMMYDMGDRKMKKRFLGAQVVIAASNVNQEFTFEVFIDNKTSPSYSETKTVAEILEIQGRSAGAFGTTLWGSNRPGKDQVGFINYFYDGFVPDFGRISFRITNEDAYLCYIGQVNLRYSFTDEKINDFVPY